VYATPIFGVSGGRPLSLIEQVVAPDSQTLMIRWRGPYPDAGTLGNNFQALPRHVLERAYEQDDPEAFLIHPFWSTEYVGLGPYRLDRWEPGASIEGSAFDGHALGRPKLDAIRIRFIPDENTGLTTLLAEDVHYATGRSLRFEHALVLKREWGPASKGTVLLTPDSSRFTHVQFRTDLVNPQSLHDLRVRRAIVHAIDSEALNDGLFEGIGSMQGTLVGRFSRYDRFHDMEKAVAEVDKVTVRYPFDLRRAEDLLAEAGFRRAGDGLQTSATGERLNMEVWADAGPQYEKEQAILAATWRQAGIEARANFVPPTRLRDGQFRSSFPALHTTSVARLESLASSAIPTPATRWSGSNRGSWSSPEYDRLWDLLNTTLDPDQRIQQAAAMMRLMTEQLPMWVLYHNTSVSAHLAGLTGPDSALLNADVWNIHTWELR
jgi:peptide/nickel transport system substrate-binding protein